MGAGRRTLVALGLLLISGCATLDIPWLDRTPRATAKNPVVQIVAMWETSEGRDPNGAPCRGFAGQIMFLGNKGGTPVAVDGGVSVYVFDDMGDPAEQSTPIHQFNFDSVAWNRHLHVGTLGPAYNCFIPYTRPGNLEANCTLRLKLTPKEGQTITSDASHIVMRGKKRNAEPRYTSTSSSAYQVSQSASERGPRTTTIPLEPTESRVQPASYSTEDRARAVLQEYLQEKAAQEQLRAIPPQTSVSPRIRFNGQQVEVIDQAAAASRPMALRPADESGTTQNYLSANPLAVTPSGPTRPHPLRDPAPEASDGAPASRVQAAAVDRWMPASAEEDAASSIEDLDGQTTHVAH